MTLSPYLNAVIHECGHAVAVHLVGRSIQELYALPNGHGLCTQVPRKTEFGDINFYEMEVRNNCFIAFAGYVAQYQAMGADFDHNSAYSLGEPADGIYPDNDFGQVRYIMETANKNIGEEWYTEDYFKEIHAITRSTFEDKVVWEALVELMGEMLKEENSVITGDVAHSTLSKQVKQGQGYNF